MTPRSKKLLALVTYGVSLYARATCESRAERGWGCASRMWGGFWKAWHCAPF